MHKPATAFLACLLLIAAACGGGSQNDTAKTDTAQVTPTPAVTAAASTVLPEVTATPTPTPEPEPTPPPTPEPTPPPAPPAEPVRVQIPKIRVDAKIIPVGVTATGEMDSPKDAWSVGWYSPGYKPFDEGNAVIAGHVDFVNVGPAVFSNLKLLTGGDRIIITAADGKAYEFEVKDAKRFTPSDAPVNEIFGPNPNRGLNLITCEGTFNTRTRDYDQRLVVFTEFVSNPAQ